MATTKQQYYYGLGRRKSSTSTSRLFAKGKGTITVNNQPALEYFDNNEYLVSRLQKPFEATSTVGQFDVAIVAKGGGHSSQVDAVNTCEAPMVWQAIGLVSCTAPGDPSSSIAH
jgi:small subunit ribosomal protein S9